jgi:hypothetical protein
MTIKKIQEYLQRYGQAVPSRAPVVVQIVVGGQTNSTNGVFTTLYSPNDALYLVDATHMDGLLALCDDLGADVRIE